MDTQFTRHELLRAYPTSVRPSRRRFFDFWTKQETRGTGKGLHGNLGKTAK